MPAAEDASALKQKGNLHFQNGKFAEAVALYKRAESTAPQDPVYPSNLSAALYELGDYSACFQAICRAVSNASNPKDDHSSLLSRLSLRMAKSLSLGSRNGMINTFTIEKEKTAVERLKTLGKSSDPKSELAITWEQWRRVEEEAKSVSNGVEEAKTRLTRLPLYRKIFCPSLEYYSIGQDDPLSIVEDWGPQPEEANPMNLSHLTAEQRAHLAFLFAGVARHVYASMIGIHRAYERLSKLHKKELNVHLTLLDIHPTALARDLIIMLLLEDLISAKSRTECDEIKATILYTFASALMPPVCFQRFMNTVDHLLTILQSDPAKLPSWIYIVPSVIPSLIDSLTYWKTRAPSKSSSMTLQYHTPSSETNGEMLDSLPIIAAEMQAHEAERTKALRAEVDKMPDKEVIKRARELMPEIPDYPKASDPEGDRGLWLKLARDEILDYFLEATGSGGFDKGVMTMEAALYKGVKVLVPPKKILKESKPLEEAWRVLRDIEDRRRRPSPETTDEGVKSAKTFIENNWKPNISLFDSFQEQAYAKPGWKNFGATLTTEHATGYPDLCFETFDIMQQLEQAAERLGVLDKKRDINKDCPSFSIASAFFDGVAEALKAMKDKVKWEILRGDMCQRLLSMRLGKDTDRPEEFPRKFMRIWQSNVPDYTHGPLNSAIYVAPCLEDDPHASTSSNCLLNCGNWKSGDDFCHTYTLLYSSELKRFLGLRVKDMVPVFGLITLVPLSQSYPLPLSQLTSRAELTHWLTRILLNTIAPGDAQRDRWRVRLPNNLTTFLNILLHLHNIGYPGHYLSHFLSDVVTDSLYSTAVPYVGQAPIPLREHDRSVPKRKLHLHPWMLDFELMISSAYEMLPFPLLLPNDSQKSEDDFHVASMDEMGCYEANMTQWALSYNTPFLFNNDPTLSLVFRQPGAPEANILAKKMNEVVEGKLTKKGQIYVQTIVEQCDMRSGKVVWKMRKSRFEKMKREGWTVEPIRNDIQQTAAYRVPWSDWKEATSL
ncbi:hypothetical protein D9758_003390 [Tetrapyrgos nigripes]|uniref:DUF4470 domain-containing protein n=1 Tax=Tetrapyrgos nigripes TaxID=182062 RepID=A0A8H5GUY4_9AGAR|nr:hypothetical protein D9758_003390 [Tetrapyrgos nigripes]